MLRSILNRIVELIARIHNKILSLNDAYEYNFTDKQLHFLVIGIFGMLLLFLIYPLFKYLAKRDHILTISWIYVFTLVLGFTLAIEIGQKITGTGNMEFADIVFGVMGFILMFVVFALIRWVIRKILRK